MPVAVVLRSATVRALCFEAHFVDFFGKLFEGFRKLVVRVSAMSTSPIPLSALSYLPVAGRSNHANQSMPATAGLCAALRMNSSVHRA